MDGMGSIASLSTALASASTGTSLNVDLAHATMQLDKIVGAQLAQSIGLGRHVDAFA